MQASNIAASDIGAHHTAAWLLKVDLLGAFSTFQDKVRALITYPRVRLGKDNLGLCKLPRVDVFDPDSEKIPNTDIYINPASQELYADFYNGMLGTTMTWKEIFAQTDREINLQWAMNVIFYGRDTGAHDWVPDRAIGPIDDTLNEAERNYHDQSLAEIMGKFLEDIRTLPTAQKCETLMQYRKGQLTELIQAYYRARAGPAPGYSPRGRSSSSDCGNI